MNAKSNVEFGSAAPSVIQLVHQYEDLMLIFRVSVISNALNIDTEFIKVVALIWAVRSRKEHKWSVGDAGQ